MTNPAETVNNSPETKEPKEYQAVIAEIEKRTGKTCGGREIRVVVEAIADVADKPDPELVMKVLCQIAEQGGFNMVGNHSDAILAGQARRAWEQVNEAQSAEKSEPNVTAQAEGETGDTSSEIEPPPINKVVTQWNPIDIPATMDPNGGPQGAPGELMDEIV